MADEIKQEESFTIRFTDTEIIRDFQSLDDLAEWGEAQCQRRSKWIALDTNKATRFESHQTENIRSMLANIKEDAKQHEDPELRERVYSNIFEHARVILPAESSLANLFFELEESQQIDARYGLSIARTDRGYNSHPLNQKRDPAAAVIFILGSHRLLARDQDELSGDRQKEWNARLTQFGEQANKRLYDVDERIETAKQTHASLLWRVRQRNVDSAKQLKRHRGEMERAESVFQELENVYEKKLQIEAPANYWANLESRHKWMARLWMVVTLCLYATGFFSVAATGLLLLLPMQAVTEILGDLALPFGLAERFAATSNSLPEGYDKSTLVLKSVAFATFVGFLYWIIRLANRNYITHNHLRLDAEERRVMISTYLSLSKKEMDLDHENIRLILERIFRPASDGLVKDDGGPAPVVYQVIERATSSVGRGGKPS